MRRPQMSRCPICASQGVEFVTSRDCGPWFEVTTHDKTVRLFGYACASHTEEFGPAPFRWPNDERGLRVIFRSVEGD